ncbi:MAG: hypothetical protein AAFR57_15815, partial [Pseudomonadota bacterium]
MTAASRSKASDKSSNATPENHSALVIIAKLLSSIALRRSRSSTACLSNRGSGFSIAPVKVRLDQHITGSVASADMQENFVTMG